MKNPFIYDQKYAYDIEVFPNFFCATFVDVDTGDKSVFTLYDKKDDRARLISFLNWPIELIGFNNLGYDGPVLFYLITETRGYSVDRVTNALFNLSAKLIAERSSADPDIRRLRYPRGVKYHQVDLQKIMAFDQLRVSLKQIAINLKWPRIQDLPLPYNIIIEPHQVELIHDYNLNDVGITLALYKSILPLVKLRQELSLLYGVDLTSASDSRMANLILEHIYATENHVNLADIKELRTHRTLIDVKDCIASNINFKTPGLVALLDDLKSMTMSADNEFAFSKHVKVGNTTYDLGIGGLHSRDEPAKFVAQDGFAIRDADVASYYPNIILNGKLAPAHLKQNDFLRILRKITTERIAAKKAGEKIKADGLKITINSIFGKLGSDTFWLLDYLCFLSVTIRGQLYLLMLIERLEMVGIPVISANTDGIVAHIPSDLDDTYHDICERWQKHTGFELEFSDYKLYVRSDVNNYLTIKTKGETKAKGRYVQDIDLKKGFKHPIVPKCIYEYFVNGQSVDDTLAQATDILDFCISQKSGSDFQVEARSIEQHSDRSVYTSDVLQKTNRFYVSKKGCVLTKVRHSNSKEISVMARKTVVVVNDLDPNKPLADYEIDYAFYKKEANKYILKIDPEILQLGLFA